MCGGESRSKIKWGREEDVAKMVLNLNNKSAVTGVDFIMNGEMSLGLLFLTNKKKSLKFISSF
ncbi:hypothetical protein C4F50_25495 [Flavobacterium sp. KB82]|uniref:Uncharacterized protein n=1 Tax=Flavobacterium hungaricum TaxID=2082725 RepID=A0ABR9TSE3_9FLAO|nr:hypothetical protein [Flavobacterium hungaricum]